MWPIYCSLIKWGKREDNHTEMNKILANEDFDTVIVCVGTNTLARKNPECVGVSMKNLIYDTKKQEKRVSVSSKIKRYMMAVSHQIP